MRNLTGSYQRGEPIVEAYGGIASASAFRSRQASLNLTSTARGQQKRKMRYAERISQGWSASIWDEVCCTADGALLRTIRILITDGPQHDSEVPG
jgi:hypothetical protein